MALKNIPDAEFPDDDGSADDGLARALAAWDRDRANEPHLLRALAGARLLVPVVAVLGEAEVGPDGLRREKTSDMAVPTLTAPDGRRALPVFTSTAALARWRPDARPVAVRLPQVLSAAAQEGAGTVVLDLAGPVTYPLTGAALRTLAGADAAPPVTEDPTVTGTLRTVLAGEPTVRSARLLPGTTTDGTLAITLEPDSQVRAVVARLAEALARDEVLRSRLVRGLDVALVPERTAQRESGLAAVAPFYQRAGEPPAH